MAVFFFVLSFLALVVSLTAGQVYKQPEQVHLSWGSDASRVTVTWSTLNATSTPTVWYGSRRLENRTTGTSSWFVDSGPLRRKLFVHRATVTGLTPDTTYYYHCGSSDGWSSLFNFTTHRPDADWSPKIIVFGDLGNDHAVSLAGLQSEAQLGLCNAIFHIGDFAYDLDTNNGLVGDAFMKQVEPMAAHVPYQVCPGNHEQKDNFSHYDNRFTMIGSDGRKNNFFWSYDLGPAHIILFSTEFYFFTEYGTHQMANQFRWLEDDLKKANRNRDKVPWIIVMGHRPMYAQFYQDDTIRLGYHSNGSRLFGLERLFYKHGVDVQFYGHIHNFQRLWPVNDTRAYNGSTTAPYTDPKAPVHIVTGSAGQRSPPMPVFPTHRLVAFASSDFGYTRVTIANKTHLNLEQVSINKNGTVIDAFWLIKNKHGTDAWQ